MSGQVDARAAYDAIADWYADYITGPAVGFAARAGEALVRVLGPGRGLCWDLACGTGVYADLVRDLGWTLVGSDISLGQLRHAAGRMPVVAADATRLPLAPGAVRAVTSVLCHTDVEDYAALCRSAAAALAPAGRFVHVGVHPCFIGAFVDGSDPERLVTTPGYWRRARTHAGWADGIRARVGAVHLTLGDLFQAVTAAGLMVDTVQELGEPTPDVLAIGAYKPTTGARHAEASESVAGAMTHVAFEG